MVWRLFFTLVSFVICRWKKFYEINLNVLLTCAQFCHVSLVEAHIELRFMP